MIDLSCLSEWVKKYKNIDDFYVETGRILIKFGINCSSVLYIWYLLSIGLVSLYIESLILR